VQQCVDLFSNSYARWGPKGRRPGEQVGQTAAQLRSHLDHDDAWIAMAYADEVLAGYCVGVRVDIADRGPLVWVSQLVVHPTYRQARVATTLLYRTWQFSRCYAWGRATANPFAVRALETATRRSCQTRRIRQAGPEILEFVRPHVPYLPRELVQENGLSQPRVDTRFFVDHSEMPDMQARAARADRPWALGNLRDGEEWFACTFEEQAPAAMDDARLSELLEAADRIWIQAYEGMTLDESHKWHAHASDEIDFVLSVIGGPRSARVLDVGCGDGRHVAALSKMGFDVTGVDVSSHLIERARVRCRDTEASFCVSDARDHLPDGPFDTVICLYDVIGSSSRSDDDREIVQRIASVLDDGGHVVASVMNTTPTLAALPAQNRPGSIQELLAALEALPSSATMQDTGAVFDPDLLVYFDGIYYRKERFAAAAGQTSSEFLVRDRRFASNEVRRLFEDSGLEVLEIRPVQAGSWLRTPPLSEDDPRAKELVVVARRPD
jgi:2-polyprenyl-3-methyl-5-hydroxy-6-metoxy-1,4-benzoquinol methylase/GNAT superfamily N-acetyltransferase